MGLPDAKDLGRGVPDGTAQCLPFSWDPGHQGRLAPLVLAPRGRLLFPY